MVGLVHGRRDRTRSQAARAPHGTRDRTDISAPNGYSGQCSIVNPVGFDRHTRLSATVLVRDGGGVYQGHGAADVSSLLLKITVHEMSIEAVDAPQCSLFFVERRRNLMRGRTRNKFVRGHRFLQCGRGPARTQGPFLGCISKKQLLQRLIVPGRALSVAQRRFER